MVIRMDEHSHYFQITNMDKTTGDTVINQSVDLGTANNSCHALGRTSLMPDGKDFASAKRSTPDLGSSHLDLQNATNISVLEGSKKILNVFIEHLLQTLVHR